MKCPKCGHEQSNDVQCAACGIYFAKWQQQTQRTSITIEPDSPRRRSTLWIVLALALCAVAYHYFSAPTAPVATQSTHATEHSNPVDTRSDVRPVTGIAAQLATSHPARNPIEAARNATVFIKTAWGAIGSGFIINSRCDVITNRHVVELNPGNISASVQQNPEFKMKMAEARMRLEMNLRELEANHRYVLSREGNTSRALMIEQEINKTKQQLANWNNEIDKQLIDRINKDLQGKSDQGFTATLIDGTEYSFTQVEFAPHADLAWFRLPGDQCPFIAAADSTSLQQGQKLFTIGSPSGLVYSVTSGIFSGFRNNNDQPYLQTDAPINPGNSGGPLINEQGYVVGINTSVLRDTQGIGFAVPIESVYREFPMVSAPSAP